jgi:hypothetical protein
MICYSIFLTVRKDTLPIQLNKSSYNSLVASGMVSYSSVLDVTLQFTFRNSSYQPVFQV